MKRTPEHCRFRQPLPPSQTGERFCCALARDIVGTGNATACPVSPEACAACCRWPLPAPGAINSVVAAIAYQNAARVTADINVSWREREEAARARILTAGQLETARPATADHRRDGGEGPSPPLPANLPTSPAAGPPPRLTWAVGMLTAPRRKPTIEPALCSLREAGFVEIHVFAEPDSCIPDAFRHLPVTRHGRKLGNLGNFYTTLAALFMAQPTADCYAIFQDDIEVARGLRAWCDEQFWPDNAGLVSLYTCGVYYQKSQGWQVLKPGMNRTFGGQAFVFRRDVLKDFLADGRALDFQEVAYGMGDDAIVGEWATRRGLGIAYHTPSLVDHIGDTSAISVDTHGTSGPQSRTQAVRSVGELRRWQASPKAPGSIGLVGWNTASGLGYLNRSLATHLPITKWLVPEHPRFAELAGPPATCRIDRVALTLTKEEQRAWLRGLDWLLFAEFPYLPHMVHQARELGINVACIPMWELTDLQVSWVQLVDLMICPTGYTRDVLGDWKRRFGFPWEVSCVPWPVDAQRLRFRRREKCRKFVFVNGTGGCRARRSDGSFTAYRRKGLELVLAAARMLPSIPFLVYSQADALPALPGNVELRSPPASHERLYGDGDVCVQPSHWEGLGLQLLECQAAGLPLITTDAPPMNEFQPWRAVRVAATELVSILGNHVLTSHQPSAEDLAQTLESVYQTDVSQASQAARAFIEREHSWDRAKPRLLELLVG